MALENITVSPNSGIVGFTDRDRNDMIATVALSLPELAQIVAAVKQAGFTLPQVAGEPCPFCHDRAEHDPEWATICREGMEAEANLKRVTRPAFESCSLCQTRHETGTACDETAIRQGFADGRLTNCDDCGATIRNGHECTDCEPEPVDAEERYIHQD